MNDQNSNENNAVRSRFLPAWYLPKGTKNALEAELEDASSSCERWGIWCGALVVVSVIAELVIAWLKPPYDTFLNESAVTDAAVAIGIIGEVLFGMWNNRIQTELRKQSNDKLGAAVKNAGEAQLETARLKAQFSWRDLGTQADKLLESLEKTPGKVAIEYFEADPDSSSFAKQFVTVFRLAKWAVTSHAGTYGTNIWYGVLIPEPDSRYDSSSFTASIREAFIDAGVEFATGRPEKAYVITDDTSRINLGTSAARIFIGPKNKLPPIINNIDYM